MSGQKKQKTTDKTTTQTTEEKEMSAIEKMLIAARELTPPSTPSTQEEVVKSGKQEKEEELEEVSQLPANFIFYRGGTKTPLDVTSPQGKTKPQGKTNYEIFYEIFAEQFDFFTLALKSTLGKMSEINNSFLSDTERLNRAFILCLQDIVKNKSRIASPEESLRALLCIYYFYLYEKLIILMNPKKNNEVITDDNGNTLIFKKATDEDGYTIATSYATFHGEGRYYQDTVELKNRKEYEKKVKKVIPSPIQELFQLIHSKTENSLAKRLLISHLITDGYSYQINDVEMARTVFGIFPVISKSLPELVELFNKNNPNTIELLLQIDEMDGNILKLVKNDLAGFETAEDFVKKIETPSEPKSSTSTEKLASSTVAFFQREPANLLTLLTTSQVPSNVKIALQRLYVYNGKLANEFAGKYRDNFLNTSIEKTTAKSTLEAIYKEIQDALSQSLLIEYLQTINRKFQTIIVKLNNAAEHYGKNLKDPDIQLLINSTLNNDLEDLQEVRDTLVRIRHKAEETAQAAGKSAAPIILSDFLNFLKGEHIVIEKELTKITSQQQQPSPAFFLQPDPRVQSRIRWHFEGPPGSGKKK